jgi:hypothetical protein
MLNDCSTPFPERLDGFTLEIRMVVAIAVLELRHAESSSLHMPARSAAAEPPSPLLVATTIYTFTASGTLNC